MHQWTVTKNGRPRNPNRLVIDLDPGDPAGLGECAQVALLVRDRLAADGLDSAPVTSGSKGLHLYAGLDGERTHEQVRDYAKGIAEELEKAQPKLVVSQMTKATPRRQGVPRLVPEHRREDDDLAVLVAWAGAARWLRLRAPGTRWRRARRTRWHWSTCASRRSSSGCRTTGDLFDVGGLRPRDPRRPPSPGYGGRRPHPWRRLPQQDARHGFAETSLSSVWKATRCPSGARSLWGQ